MVALALSLIAPASHGGCEGEAPRAEARARNVEDGWPLRSSGDKVTRYAQSLIERLARGTRGDLPERWRLRVITDVGITAFSIGNGHVYISEGIILLAATEAEVAAILAHEIAHQIAGHFCETGRHTALPGNGVQYHEFGSMTQVIDNAKEQQADRIAIGLLRKHGFDARALLAMTERTRARSGTQQLMNPARIGALKARLIALYGTLNPGRAPSKRDKQFAAIKKFLHHEER